MGNHQYGNILNITPNSSLITMDQNKKENHSQRNDTKFSNDDIQRKIQIIENLIQSHIPNYRTITSDELITYFAEPAPSGDITNLEDILENKWLLIHELVELSELKNMDLTISASLLKTHVEEVDQAHITATEYELLFANEAKQHSWIEMRLNDVQNWLTDESLSEDLKFRCEKLVTKYKV